MQLKNIHDYSIDPEDKNSAIRKLNKYFITYYLSLIFFARQYVDFAEAEDVVMEVFVACWRIGYFHFEKDNLTAALYIAVKNRCLNKRRKNETYRRAKAGYKYSQSNIVEEISRCEDEEKMLKMIYDIIEKLPCRCKRIFKMYYFSKLSTKEIADKLGISTNTVQSLRVRAIMIIKKKINLK